MNPEPLYPQPGQQPEQPMQPQYPPTQQGYDAMPAQQPIPQAIPQPAPQPNYAPIPPAHLPPIKHKTSKLWVVLTFVFIITTLAAVGGGVWALMNYFDQKDNTDSKVTTAVAEAVKKQQDTDASHFAEQEKQPNRQFAGPDDYGRLSFDYPKTWSVYVANDAASGGTYQAYFNPVSVPVATNGQLFALRVSIQQRDYDQVLTTYQSLIKTGALTSTSFKVDDQTGTRLDGSFTKDLKGSAVLFKIRDKTVIVQSDAETFKPDFDALIKTITFNK
jgi:hypothetical protein